MAEWSRLRAFEENGLNIRRIRGVSSPAAKKSIGWQVGAAVTSHRLYGRRKPNFKGSRMAEWLRLRAFEVNGLNIHRIFRARIPLPKKSIGWADGTEVTSRRYYGWHRPHYFGQQDGRVVKAPSFGGERTKYTPDMPGSNPAAKKVHRLGGWY